MTDTAQGTGGERPAIDRRERKRIATQRALSSAAMELTLERGLEHVTVDEIAARADVSPRTFFNYFCSKEEAIVGVGRDWFVTAADRLRARPAGESPVKSLASVLISSTDDVDDAARKLIDRAEIVRRYPALLPRQLAGLVELEQALTKAMAERLGLDPTRDPYPRVVVSAAVAVLRSTMEWWHQNGRPIPLVEALQSAFGTLAKGIKPPSARGDAGGK